MTPVKAFRHFPSLFLHTAVVCLRNSFFFCQKTSPLSRFSPLFPTSSALCIREKHIYAPAPWQLYAFSCTYMRIYRTVLTLPALEASLIRDAGRIYPIRISLICPDPGSCFLRFFKTFSVLQPAVCSGNK